ESAGLIPFPRV
uniref:CAPA-Periviscerokinin-1 n=1 Tax=Namaquaphasma ookiepense TaxID=409167 RepID=PVK1_NAMOO|nr:RecName: Full=CAPA-Periviscerokinin-1; Short=CAPA-PVK-1 [Namaquaphasma ookiepense]